MKRIILIHGWSDSPKEPVHIWLAEKLKQKGFKVLVPLMPNPEAPEIEPWVNHLSKIVSKLDSQTNFIGHSIGCQTILRYLEKQKTKAGKVVLIAPWMHLDEETIKEEEDAEEIAKPWMETPINFKKVKQNASSFTCIFSDDDPYVPLTDAKLFEKELNAKTIIEHHKGHFTSGDGVTTNETALKEFKN